MQDTDISHRSDESFDEDEESQSDYEDEEMNTQVTMKMEKMNTQ